MVVGVPEIFMVAVTDGVTVIRSTFDVAGLLVEHKLLEVIIHDTTSPLFRLVVLKVELLVPAFAPFTCHW